MALPGQDINTGPMARGGRLLGYCDFTLQRQVFNRFLKHLSRNGTAFEIGGWWRELDSLRGAPAYSPGLLSACYGSYMNAPADGSSRKDLC